MTGAGAATNGLGKSQAATPEMLDETALMHMLLAKIEQCVECGQDETKETLAKLHAVVAYDQAKAKELTDKLVAEHAARAAAAAQEAGAAAGSGPTNPVVPPMLQIGLFGPAKPGTKAGVGQNPYDRGNRNNPS